ncbi:hypothetical protein HXA34_01680 [Salipaludibacillus agaradhaerens]|uniref:bacilysin biosynthesis protein BacA n=1 Tax=Salipaludibacillus agaradhaerens TaxID=76935 RepID=UPI002150A604|nr:bacilysin biosynthesis protein BacA [Salipaludibacillus agaradhaerens]MCR6104994.1 hypothetical protein [Salipaludibacillus agaradhaerens]MCR6117039.1 hypothetical protein [Salipaludibacillus agaradhaerens]
MDAQIEQVKAEDVSSEWEKQTSSFMKIIEQFSNVTIATLGPTGTSSEAAAKYLLSFLTKSQGKYTLFPSFEEAYHDLVSGNANILLIANAYERIDKFYMSQDIKFLFSFVLETPLYGITKKKGEAIDNDKTLKIATHHAPSSLIPWFLKGMKGDYDILLVNSTSEAAMKLQKGEVDLSLTTANAAQEYGLEFISPTRTILMLWSIFVPNWE